MRMHDSRAVFISRRNYECKCKLLRCHTFASPVGGSWALHRKGSSQDCRTDCKADRGWYKLANLLTIRLSITVNSFANKRMVVESNTKIRFRLKNGLELPETIERTVR